MATKTNVNPAAKNYAKIGIIAAIVIAIAAGGTWLVSSLNGGSGATVEESMEEVSTDAVYTTTAVTETRAYVANFRFKPIDPREVKVATNDAAQGTVIDTKATL